MDRRHQKENIATSELSSHEEMAMSKDDTNSGAQELRELREQLLNETQKIKDYEKELKEKLEQTLAKERESVVSKEVAKLNFSSCFLARIPKSTTSAKIETRRRASCISNLHEKRVF